MSLTINGATNTVTASGTVTVPALTLAGAITGGGQNVSGLGTLACGNTTVTGTLSATGLSTLSGGALLPADGYLYGNSTAGPNYNRIRLYNGATGDIDYYASFPTGSHKFYQGGSDTLIGTFSSTGLTLGTGVNLVMASGKGIDFSATANGSGTTTSEVLSDYEEGTWTPTFTGFSVDPTATGTYTKVGRQVTVKLRTTALGTSNSTGFAIGGLPYACGITEQGQICQAADNGVNGIAIAYINATETSVALYFGAGAANWTASGNKAAYFTITYFV